MEAASADASPTFWLLLFQAKISFIMGGVVDFKQRPFSASRGKEGGSPYFPI